MYACKRKDSQFIKKRMLLVLISKISLKSGRKAVKRGFAIMRRGE